MDGFVLQYKKKLYCEQGLQGIALCCNIWRLNKLYCNLGNSTGEQ